MSATELAPVDHPRASTAVSRTTDNDQPIERSELDKILSLVENPNVDMARIEQAINLMQRVHNERARRAFEKSFAAAKAEFGQIIKKHGVTYPSKTGGAATSYKHEDIADIEAAIGASLSKHGLSYRWQTSAKVGEPVRATCIVTHDDGWFTETTLEAGRDDSGGKNAIQSIASSLTYLQRYTLRAALGIAVGRDVDGRTPPAETEPSDYISGDQEKQLAQLITKTNTKIADFLELGGIESLADMHVSQFGKAITLLNKKLNAQGNAATKPATVTHGATQ
ncbi:MAG: ERF family protein [Hyphomicrobiaceae bacterium]|nr:ERF family protein [Hyphomicrobiaceae bacterium]